MSVSAAVAPRRGVWVFRPRLRLRELFLLCAAAAVLVVGDLSLGMVRTHGVQLAQPGVLATYIGALFVAHFAQVVAGRRTDQVLLPVVGMIGGIGLLMMIRLPQVLVRQSFFGLTFGLAGAQLLWLILAIATITGLAVAVRSDSWLRLYKYTWAAAGVGLLLVTFVLPKGVNGVDVRLGPFTGQPSELLKVILVVFLAGYLSENRELLAEQSTRVGYLRLPPLPYLVPMVAMWIMALAIVIFQKDLGAALLFFAVFLIMLYIGTGRLMYVVLGLTAFVVGSFVLYKLFGVVRERVDIWLNPFSDPNGAGYQVVQALYAFARGGILGSGLGAGLPTVGGQLPIPEVHTDFVFTALGEELGLVGIMAILGLYLVVLERGLRIAASAADDFRALLAAGLTLVVGVQAFVIAAGNLKLIPLTGITLPFVSYGGSSLLANAVVVGLLLALSDRGVEPPPAPRPRRGLLGPRSSE